MNLCFATNNRHKLTEVSSVADSRFKILSLSDIGCKEEIPENFETIIENSFAKADYVFRKYKINCFADDTGLEVDALNGEPGVHSARYAGQGKQSDDNIDLLLQKLRGITDRSARFRCIITLIIKGDVSRFEGIVEGSITSARKGTGGFGYDPVFVPIGYSLTFGEMDGEEKNKISHRGIAIRKLIDYLNSCDF